MKNRAASPTRKTSSKRRSLVKRGLPPMPGSDNLVVVKRGEDLSEALSARLGEMKKDFETVEFYWNKLVDDPTYNETREFPDHSRLVAKWELREGVRGFQEYKSRMKRLKTLIDHFQPGYDYELTVKEVVEILS